MALGHRSAAAQHAIEGEGSVGRKLTRVRLVGAALLVAGLVIVATRIAFDAATFAVVFIVGLILSAVIPFGLGFLAQAVSGHRRIPENVWVIGAAALMLPWWFWGKGFAIAVAGPRVFSLVLSALYIAWFTSLGAAVARRAW